MRITANTFPNSLVSQLNQLGNRQNSLQTQAATGQRIQFPDDDPSATRRVLQLQTEQKSLQQYQNNLARLQEVSNASYGAMKSLKTISDRAGEIATLADGTKSRQELGIYASEVTQLIQQAVQLANTKDQGMYLFGGTKSDQAPFSVSVDADGHVASVTYHGNTDLPESEISTGLTLTAQTVGANSTGSGPRGLLTDTRSGADFLNHLVELQNNLLAGDSTAVANTDRAQLARDEDNFLFHFGTVGAIQSRLDAANSIAKNRSNDIQGLASKETDADLAQTLVRLNQTQTAYKAALQSGATILSQSLLDYLR
jgi:flagellar hook-associated protein 3 FlgL